MNLLGGADPVVRWSRSGLDGARLQYNLHQVSLVLLEDHEELPVCVEALMESGTYVTRRGISLALLSDYEFDGNHRDLLWEQYHELQEAWGEEQP